MGINSGGVQVGSELNWIDPDSLWHNSDSQISHEPHKDSEMSAESNKLLIRQYIENVVNTGDISLVEEYISPEYVEVYDGKRYRMGIAGAKEHIIGVRTTYPDLRLAIEQQIAEADWVATCITACGTHKGVWMGIEPTGKMVTYTGVNVDKVVDGRIIEHGGAANMLGPLLEIGAIKIAAR
jgi:predicted ester cyclase